MFYRQTCSAMKTEPTTGRGGIGPGLTIQLSPQCGAFNRDLLDGMSKTPAIPGAGAVLTYDVQFCVKTF